MKFIAVCLVVLAFSGYGDAQGKGKRPADPTQQKIVYEKELTWKYPSDPVPDPKVDVPFQQNFPVAATTVAVECREDMAHVEAKKDLFGIGQLIDPADLTLGNCPAVAEDTTAQVLIFQSALQDCGSTLTMTEDSLIYSFTLNYNPQALGSAPVVRTSQAVVIVECHYPRKHNVSSLAIDPLWVPYSSAKMAEEFLYFTLTLMTDDFQYERPSYQYFLGDMIYIQATVKQYFHVPLRVFVDSCVATLTPDATSSPRYAFIDHCGCLLDARITGSQSKFVARPTENKLQFQLEAFRFQGSESGLMYITCHLKATSGAYPLDEDHRACSYINGWREISGADGVCGNCESSGFDVHAGAVLAPGTSILSGGGTGQPSYPGKPADPSRKVRAVKNDVVEFEGVVVLGPIPVGERKD